jgi:hypothetical protein
MSTLGDELMKEIAASRDLNSRLKAENAELKDNNAVLKNLLSAERAEAERTEPADTLTRYSGMAKKTAEIVVDLKHLVPGRTYMCELIKIDDDVEIVALRATDFSVYEKQQGFKKGVCTCGI